jgi:hypothetical protein
MNTVDFYNHRYHDALHEYANVDCGEPPNHALLSDDIYLRVFLGSALAVKQRRCHDPFLHKRLSEKHFRGQLMKVTAH